MRLGYRSQRVQLVAHLFLGILVARQVSPQVSPVTASPGRYLIRVGVAAVQQFQPTSIGFAQCGGALALAVERLRADGYAANFDFEFLVNYTECDRSQTVAVGIEFMKNQAVDVVIGPPCQSPLVVMGALSNLYRTPLMGWGFASASEFTDASRFPYLTTVIPNSQSLGYSVSKVLETFRWNKVGLYYVADEMDYCSSVINDVEAALNDASTYPVDISLKLELPTSDDAVYESSLSRAKSRVRILLVCIFSGPDKRTYMAKASKLGMTTNEYVHILLSLRSSGYVIPEPIVRIMNNEPKRTGTAANGNTILNTGLSPFWEDTTNKNADGLDAVAKEAAKKLLVIDLNSDVSDLNYLKYFQTNVLDAVRRPPISCVTTDCLANTTGSNMGAYARHLHDAMYLYGLTVSQMPSSQSFRDADAVLVAMRTTFPGLTGEVTINQNNSRLPLFMLYGLGPKYNQESYMNITYLNSTATVSLAYRDESTLWAFWGGTRPLTTPVCGFLGDKCPKEFWEQYGTLVIVLAAVLALILVAFILFLIYIIRSKRLEQERINAEWQVPFVKLQKPPTKRERDRQSKRSLQSGPSTMTGDSKFTYDGDFSNYTVYFLDREPVLTSKHPASTLTKADYEHFVKLRKLDHDNVNKFVGMSIDGAEYVVVWKMCARGSLQDIISRGNFSMDPFFMFCIIRDVAEGLNYLHHSFLPNHGNLRSATCLVNDSWQAKLTDFGLDCLIEESTPSKKRQLWVAPEVLRNATPQAQIAKSADVYSFAIVASEILTRKPAWNLADRKESADELIYLIKKGGLNPFRPVLDMDGVDINQALLHLVRDCWSEMPEERPLMDVVCNMLRGMMPNKKSNLMDHVFNMLEEYTTTLELEVEERTKELSAEKKKADVLLGRMLPKQVAERLKLGQTVEPEGFDSVTVFFSDVVKFTILATKCSPFQVVNLLNDLYSNFDSIIEEHGVYKVESIGDGYLCVSGLPARNGYAHIREIVEMSLDFMEYVKSFKIPHLPRESVELRIGINSGPCVAGVVGLSMPRYCLFGDTVNTASRMESNGKASHIHLSGAAHHLLVTQYPQQYETQSRGDVIIKGKGVMETFWLHGRKGERSMYNTRSTETPPVTKKLPPPPTKVEAPVQRAKTKTADSMSSSNRSVSPFVEDFIDDDGGNEALYRKFRRSETIPAM